MAPIEELEELIGALEQLPTIGRKSGTRLALFLAKNRGVALRLLRALEEVVAEVGECSICGGLSRTPICPICRDREREPVVAVVEREEERQLLEEVGVYRGYYFFLPEKWGLEEVERLREFIRSYQLREVLFAFPPSSGNRLKILQIKELLGELPVKFTQLAQGVPTGVLLENLDLWSVASAVKHRHPIEEEE
ncbi:MAG: recombination protein RecR [Campylobacterales bacterium]